MDLNTLAAAYTAAWNTGNPASVAAFFASDGEIAINRGPVWQGRDGVAAMAAGFYADIPDLCLACDDVRRAGDHAVYCWTFTGTFAANGKRVKVAGWEEWDLDPAGLIVRSRGWFDAEAYARQTG
jgi:uncharacterized protein (TIGR02246 family)